MSCFILFVVNTCDKKVTRKVEHAKYSISDGELRSDSTLPMNVSYTCDVGYSIQNSTKYSVVYEFHMSAENDQGDATASPQWMSCDGRVCANGQSELQ